MPREQIYKNLWIRWVHSTWKKGGDWITDISPNTLHDKELAEAQFIFDDHSCVFIPLDQLRKAISNKPPGKNGMIKFNVNPRRKTVDGVRIDLTVVESATKKKKDKPARLFETF